MRFFRKSSSKGSRSSRASADDTSSERSVPVSGEGGGEEEATHPTDMEMNAATALQSWARGRSIRKSLEDEAVDESESASATGQVGDAATATGSEDEPTVAVTPGSPREPGEYVVKLRRNNSPSIGMRLVQKRYDDQPCIADIDPTGPAAGHDIASGDILLEVNGVDARASHEELKKALGSTDSATLRLRRPRTGLSEPSTPTSLVPSPAPKSTAPPNPIGIPFFPCCMHRAG